MTTIEEGSVLVGVSEYGEFSSLIPLCKSIESRFGLHPVFVFTAGYGLWKDHGQLVELENWSWVRLGSKTACSFRRRLDEDSRAGYFRVYASSRGDLNRTGQSGGIFLQVLKLAVSGSYVMRRLAQRWRSASDSVPLGARRHWDAQVKHARRLFDLLKPRLVLSGQDYILSVTSILAKVAEERGVKTAIVPYSMPPTTRELIESFAYGGYNRLRGLELLLAPRLNQKLLNSRRGSIYARLNLIDAIHAERLGLTPAEPWLPNSGRGVVFVPSRQAYDYYAKAGIPESQLRLTGASWSDHFVRSAATIAERKDKLLERVRSLLSGQGKRRAAMADALKANKRLVIVSWPPNQWPRKALGCLTYSDLCQQFINALGQIQGSGLASVVVSLHPTVNDKDLLDRLAKAGIYVLRSSLIRYLDCADVFVSTVSSTSFWALQCGIPTINFDGYLYGYTEFDEAGAITVRTPQDVYESCEQLFERPGYMAEVVEQIRVRAAYFTLADGACMSRIMDELGALVAMAPGARSGPET